MLLKDKALVPDAYFQIQRVMDGAPKTSGFFLELQRAVKSERVLEGKLRRYLNLYQSGKYQAMFGTAAMRVLVIFTNEWGGPAGLRVRRGVELADRTGAEPAWFSGLDDVVASGPVGCLLHAFWRAPGKPEPVALFSPARESLA
jgi:hypothetical protein